MADVDAAWLGMDSPDNLMMVTAVLALDDLVDWQRLRDVLEQRMVRRYPRLTMRALPSGSPFEQPVWVDDPDFSLDHHLVDGGEIADEHELEGLVSELLGSPLDMKRPPWQLHLVTIRSPYGGAPSAALVARLHHCIADGIALAQVLLSLTDDAPDTAAGAGGPAPDPDPEVDVDVDVDLRRPGLRHRLVSGSAEIAPVTGVDVLATRSLRQLPAGLRLGGQVVVTGLGLLLANRDPRTRLRGRLGTTKAAAWSKPVDLRLVKRVAAALGATVNDVMLAVTAGALRRHLVEHGDQPHDLRIFVPVDLRRGEPVPETLGNKFGLVFVRLPVSEPDPVARVRAVHHRMRRVKAGAQATATFALLAVVGALPAWGHRLAVRILGAKCSAIVTNVPGPRRPVWLAGSRLVRVVFWVPQAGAIGLGVSILSYAGEIGVGVAADRNVVPDPGRLVATVESELDELARRVLAVDDSAVELEAVAFDSDLAAVLVAEVQQEYVRRYGGHDETPVDPAEFAPPYGTFLVARVGTTAIGCAGLRRHGDGVVEVKRMFVRPEHRRRGHARRLLAALEDVARAGGDRRVVLETGLAQPEAIALYASAGYLPIEGFGHYKDAPLSRSFGKDL
jgi:diacylglycerol O-acyltransferase